MSDQYKTSLLFTEKPHVLVVDDDERLRDLLKRYLTGQGFIVITADDAENALEKLKRFAFDIAILDVMMPGEDGISLASKMRKIYPVLQEIKVKNSKKTFPHRHSTHIRSCFAAQISCRTLARSGFRA